MTDIAQTLRQWATVLKIPSGNFVNEDLRFAAEEIERLRQGYEAVMMRWRETLDLLHAANAENERLRAALTQKDNGK